MKSICHCSIEYASDLMIYTGHANEIIRISALGISGPIIMPLMEKDLDNGHILYLFIRFSI